MKHPIHDPAGIPVIRNPAESFRNISENAPVGIYQSSIYRFIAANPMLAGMFGYQNPSEMAASVEIPGELFVEIDQERAIVCEAMASETAVQRQVEFLRKDGSTFSGNLRMKAVRNEQGKLRFINALVEDLTGRKRAGDERPKMLLVEFDRPSQIWLVSNWTDAVSFELLHHTEIKCLPGGTNCP
jgi:PAS domain S-box-containing protein